MTSSDDLIVIAIKSIPKERFRTETKLLFNILQKITVLYVAYFTVIDKSTSFGDPKLRVAPQHNFLHPPCC
jgi:hypothetical protein